jgi:hypothetical protein
LLICYPAWLDNLADDVTLEGSMMDGFVQGPEAVRTVLNGSAPPTASTTPTPDGARPAAGSVRPGIQVARLVAAGQADREAGGVIGA